MEIENIYFDIISKGEESPETHPNIGEAIQLFVRLKDKKNEINDLNTVNLTPRSVEELGQNYSHVIGNGSIDASRILPCEARYAINGQYPLGTTIGEVVFKISYE